MSRQIKETALRVRQALEPSEAGAVAVLARIGLLLHTACVESERLGLAPQASRGMVNCIGTAVARQIEVQEALLDAHEQASRIYRALDPEVAAGDHGCPPQHVFTEGALSLQPVAAAA